MVCLTEKKNDTQDMTTETVFDLKEWTMKQ